MSGNDETTATLPRNVQRLLRDPEALAALDRLRFLGYSPEQVAATMSELDRRESGAS